MSSFGLILCTTSGLVCSSCITCSLNRSRFFLSTSVRAFQSNISVTSRMERAKSLRTRAFSLPPRAFCCAVLISFNACCIFLFTARLARSCLRLSTSACTFSSCTTFCSLFPCLNPSLEAFSAFFIPCFKASYSPTNSPMGLSNHAGAFGCPNNCKLMNFANDSGTSVGLMMYLVAASGACSCDIPASSRATSNRSDADVRKSSMSFCARVFALWSMLACSIVPTNSRKAFISSITVS